MKKKNQVKLILLTFSALSLFLLTDNILAADTFDFSYTLTEGGSRLELGSATQYKGVRIDISSNVATRYQVIHKIQQPLINRDNPSIILTNNFVFRGLRGTNQFGNFRVPTNDTPVRSDEILYVSDSNGSADTFTLVYGLTEIESLAPGYYQGQISFTLKPIDSTRQLVTKYLYVYVTISRNLETKPTIEFETATGSRKILLNPKRDEYRSADVLVKINGIFKKLFNITQFAPQPLESNDGKQMDLESIKVEVREARKGMGIPPIPLSSRPQNIYTSGQNGEADQSFVISYSLGDLSQARAGRYTSRIQYFIDEMGVQSKLETLELEVENERIFDLTLVPQDQKSSIDFRNLKPKDPPRTSEVLIEIKTNLGKAYQLSQKVASDLTNKEGNIIGSDYFTLRTESLETKGMIKLPQKTGVQKGETVLYISDNKGSSDKFKVIYELKCPEDLKAGDYSTRITYSLLEI